MFIVPLHRISKEPQNLLVILPKIRQIKRADFTWFLPGYYLVYRSGKIAKGQICYITKVATSDEKMR